VTDAGVRAAGGVVWRDAGGVAEVVLVYRPRYGDWTFPKGKSEPGESSEDCALREVLEETGLRCRLGAGLPTVTYTDRRGRPKVVHYWAMTVAGGRFQPNSEVDELRWLVPDDAATLLSYERDLAVLRAFVRSQSDLPGTLLA
jgi:8-oxo-dGTP pyrophosphatase MutT (NUDIX family)